MTAILPYRSLCPDCFAVVVTDRRRISLEFFGGEIICEECGAVLHIDHRAWWFGAAVLSIEGWALAVFGAIVLAAAIKWWSIPLFVAAFVSAGTVVAIFSPLKVVGHRR